jgi:hypothetical protein
MIELFCCLFLIIFIVIPLGFIFIQCIKETIKNLKEKNEN